MNIEDIPLEQLVLDPANVRQHPEKNIAAIKASLARFGQQKPIVVDEKNVVRAGNGTLLAAKELGWKTLRCVRSELKGAELTAFALADNRTAEMAEWDASVLDIVTDLKTDLPDLDFANLGLDDLFNEVGRGELTDGQVVQDEAPAPPDEAITKRGDLWILGNHRLLCGDSSSAADLDRLLDGAKIQLVNTDPPYNVKVEPRSNNAIAAGLSSFPASASAIAASDARGMHHQGFDLARDKSKAHGTTGKMRAKDRPLINDFVSDEDFDKMLRAWFGNIARVLELGRGFYIWGGYANIANYPSALKECELYFSQTVIWVKEHPVLTRKDFMGNHEWCFYGWREGAAHFFNPSINNATDVWSVKKVNPQSMVHLTEKPVELAVRAMNYSSRPGENVLDLFGGSGSTMIAAEQCGRKAFLMELDPPYCDVIVERYEKFTGKKAERIALNDQTPALAGAGTAGGA